MPDPVAQFLSRPASALGKPVCRLGLGWNLESVLEPDDFHYALEHGVNFLNWPGSENTLSQAIGELGPAREQVAICVQFEPRTAAQAAPELERMLSALKTDYLDVLTFYYVEEAREWDELRGSAGALKFCQDARRDRRIRRLGVTTHQRPLAAEIARSGELDLLMIRYNAAHRGAETEIFPVTDSLAMPIIAYTALRWGALLEPTPDDPPGFVVPRPSSWYRFVLQSPSVTVTLTSPRNRAELTENLETLESAPLTSDEYERLANHGRRIRRRAGPFP